MSAESFERRVDAITVAELRETGSMRWSDPEIMGAFVAEMDFGIAPVITEALHAAVDEGAFGYTPRKYADPLKAATAARLHRLHGWTTDPEHVLLIPEVFTALTVTIEHFTRPGSKVIVPTPSYMPFLSLPPILGREVIEVPMLREDGVWRFDLEGIQQAFDDGGECLIVCNPFNPLGRVFTREELLEVSVVVDRHGGRVFSDEIWAPLIFDGRELVPYATLNDVTAGHTITGTSASKAFNLPGLKCAQLITSNDADQAKIDEIAWYLSHGTATPGIIASTVAYEEGESWLADTVAYLQGNRDEMERLVAEHLPGVRYLKPEGTYVAWLDFTEAGIEDPESFFREHAGVGLTDGRACGQAGTGCARLITASPRPVLREMVTRMGEAMRRNR